MRKLRWLLVDLGRATRAAWVHGRGEWKVMRGLRRSQLELERLLREQAAEDQEEVT